MIWSAIILPWLRRRRDRPFRFLRGFLVLGTGAVLCCAFSYAAQEAILKGISHGSELEKRQAAATLTLIAASVQDENAVLEGMDLRAIDSNSPEAKSFFALLPALALTTNDLPERTEVILDDLLRFQAEKAIGSFQDFYNIVYLPSETGIKRLYNAYLPAAEEHRRAHLNVDTIAQEKYRQYRRSLGRIRPDQIQPVRYRQVRNSVRSAGVPVPDDWRPTDRAGFMRAARSGIIQRAEFGYRRALEPALGFVPPDDLSPAGFVSQEAIQARWRRQINMHHPIDLRISLSPDEARQQIYEPWIAAIMDDRRPLYHAEREAFAEGGEWHDDGITAIRVAWIPLIALAISLVGALVHIFKTGAFALQGILGTQTRQVRLVLKIGKLCLAGVILVASITVSRIDNPVTRSDLFLRLEDRTADKLHPVIAQTTRFVIQLQPFAYPVADTLRRDLLFGISFDFDPETQIPAFGVD